MKQQPAPSAPSISPYLFYKDPAKGFAFLLEAFGLEKRMVNEVDGQVVNAQAGIGSHTVIIGQARAEMKLQPASELPAVHAGVMMTVEDVDAHYRHAKDAGAVIEYEPQDMPYGLREYGARDLEGNLWFFASHLTS
ncbi:MULTISPECIES: VOC family protein [unclassified Streptomyces]|uniref:VOC family protein n=1 Tax=unclassified Streptomyces TaxID=2593676 RepID=UPI000366BB56|nr:MULTISPECIES: VOC family protein [unclassified Streptomyces]MYT29258.1 bleomycin resistance protein [Streptomyces sp. SID8354]